MGQPAYGPTLQPAHYKRFSAVQYPDEHKLCIITVQGQTNSYGNT